MDAVEYQRMLLEDCIEKLFPNTLIEIKRYPGVGMWPYILDQEGNQIEDNIIASVLVEYIKGLDDREEKRHLFIAVNHCLETFTDNKIMTQLFR